MTRRISFNLLNDCVSYDENTGVLTWKERPRSHFPNDWVWLKFQNEFSGKEVGCLHGGYIRFGLTINAQQYWIYAHRAVWCLKTGDWPVHVIDHIDGDKSNNKWGNLREATIQQNLRNTPVRSHSKTGIKGVSLKKNGKYAARITINKKLVNLGTFVHIHDATNAFSKRAQLEHGEFTHSSIQLKDNNE